MELNQTIINDLNMLFDEFINQNNIDLENQKLTTNRYNAIMMHLYTIYVSKLEITNNKGIKQYSYIDYITIVEWYINKSLYLDIISLFGFCCLINRSTEFIRNIKYMDSKDYLNSFIFDIDNKNILEQSSNNNINNSQVSINTDIEKASLLLQNVTKKLFESITQSTVNKLNDTTIGLVTNANNNKDIGLMYAKERIQEQTKARLTIALNDLPKLE